MVYVGKWTMPKYNVVTTTVPCVTIMCTSQQLHGSTYYVDNTLSSLSQLASMDFSEREREHFEEKKSCREKKCAELDREAAAKYTPFLEVEKRGN